MYSSFQKPHYFVPHELSPEQKALIDGMVDAYRKTVTTAILNAYESQYGRVSDK